MLAAGEGKRFDSAQQSLPKQFWEVQSGLTVIELSLRAVLPFAKRVVIPLSLKDLKSEVDLLCKLSELAQEAQTELLFSEGGASRQQSVEKNLHLVESEYLLIHDAARPVVSEKDIFNLLTQTLKKKAAILAHPVSDTIKQVVSSNSLSAGEDLGVKVALVQNTIDRSLLWAAQTPQAFQTDLFRQAMNFANETNFVGTDDASLIEHFGEKVYLIQAQKPNPKITYKADLDYVRSLL